MFFRAKRQRPGRVFPWVVGILLLAFVAITGYQWWINRPHQEQNDALVAELKGAQLSRVVAGPAKPGDWPQWRGPNRDGIAPGDNLLTDWPAAGPPVLWRVALGGGFSSLAVSDGRLFTLIQDGDKEAVVCWNAETGDELWRFSYTAHFHDSLGGPGPRATPTVDGELVYTVGATGHLYCLEAATGKEVWHSDFQKNFGASPPQWGHSGSPLVEGDLLLANPGGPNGASVVAFDKRTGEVKWKALDDPAGYSSPVICTAGGVRQVLVFTGIALVSLDPRTGAEHWRFPWETKHNVNAATPIVVKEESGDGYVFISSGYSKGCALLKVSKDADGSLQAEQVYKNNLMKNHFPTCVLYKDHLYGFDEAYLVCMPFREGKKRSWKERRFKEGSLFLAGDHLIVLGEEGLLALVEPTPEEYREKAAFQVTESRCWTVPVLAQGRLYVRDEHELICLDLRKK